MKKILAIDLGASSGRGILASLDNGKISLTEIHRFPNNGVYVNNTLYWDVLFLYDQIKIAMTKAHNHGGFSGMGIDTWGVDFGIIDKNGALVSNPVHYRDARTEGMPDEVFNIINRGELYERTGIQMLNFNTLYQLYYLAKYQKDTADRADKILMIPDLLNYFLTGQKFSEYTNASTTQLLDPHTKTWDFGLIRDLGIRDDIFCDIVMPGTKIGKISPDVAAELCINEADVTAVGSHDTASAVLSVPGSGNFAYISCGTWSLFGTELDAPNICAEGLSSCYTNEGGVGGKIRYLTNIMGLWLIQESRRFWLKQGNDLSYADLERMARGSAPFKCFVDPDYAEFGKPGNISQRIADYCRKTGQSAPETIGETVRCIYESLALKYRRAFLNLQKITGKNFDKIHIVGGGTKDPFLCSMTASACGVSVAAGPVEATALGNVAVQLMASGDIRDIAHAREIIKNSFEIAEYIPQNTAEWNAAYERFERLETL